MDKKDTFINSVNLNENTDFPYLVLNVKNDRAYPLNPGFRVMHWHEDLQFIYCLSGNVVVRTLEEEKKLSAGEGVFINKNVVHFVDKIIACEYRSFLFPEYFVSFYAGSPAERMTKDITENKGLQLVALDGSQEWHKAALAVLRDLIQIEENKGGHYCYEVLTKLAALWCLCIENIHVQARADERPESVRVRKCLQYIEIHYADEISLSQLSKAANVSKSEILRCFNSVLHTTPYKYLMEYRLSKASRLLTDTSLSISEIAIRTGWGDQSYFTKRFREKTGCTPSEYRNT